MRAKYIVHIILGIVIVYVSFFGISGLATVFTGFSPFEVTGSFWREDFDSAAGYTHSGSILVEFTGGQLHTVQGTRLYYTGSMPEDMTIEFKLKVDSWGVGGDDGFAIVHIYNPSSLWVVFFRIYSAKVDAGTDLPSYSESTDSDWHVWTLTMDGGSMKGNAYKDGVFIYEFTIKDYEASQQNRIAFGSNPVRGNCETHFEYAYIDAGIHVPEEPDEPPDDGEEFGTIEIKAWDDDWLTASLTITYPDGSVQSGSTPFTDANAPVGSYSVVCNYMGEEKTHSFTLAADGNVEYTFEYGSSSPPEPPPDDFLAWIDSLILGNSAIRTVVLLVGASVAGYGALRFLGSDRQPYPYPRW